MKRGAYWVGGELAPEGKERVGISCLGGMQVTAVQVKRYEARQISGREIQPKKYDYFSIFYERIIILI